MSCNSSAAPGEAIEDVVARGELSADLARCGITLDDSDSSDDDVDLEDVIGHDGDGDGGAGAGAGGGGGGDSDDVRVGLLTRSRPR